MSLVPGSTLGNYQILEKIGAGGMGAVYKGYQTALGRYVHGALTGFGEIRGSQYAFYLDGHVLLRRRRCRGAA